MQTIRSSLLVLLAIAIPAVVVAAAPSGVEGIRAKVEDDGIYVEWDPVVKEGVAYYRIYYKSDSILGSQGAYDDFEQTMGAETEYTFSTIPPGDEVYISVMAVNTKEQESEFFEEEFRLELPEQETEESEPPTVPPDQLAQKPPQQTEPLVEEVMVEDKEGKDVKEEEREESDNKEVEDQAVKDKKAKEQKEKDRKAQEKNNKEAEPIKPAAPLLLMSLSVSSPTKIQIGFSEEIDIADKDAPKAFTIEKQDGKLLPIDRLEIEGRKVTIFTEKQESGAVYNLKLSAPLKGMSGANIDPESSTMLFQGHKDGVGAIQEPVQADGPPKDVQNLKVQAIAAQNNLYSVTASWNAEEQSSTSVFVVSQSFDGGMTYGEPLPLPPDARNVTVHNVPAGVLFGLHIRAMDAQGRVSQGVMEAIDVVTGQTVANRGNSIDVSQAVMEIPGYEKETDQLIADLSAKNTPAAVVPVAENLPQTGNAFVLLTLLLVGMFIGWRKSFRFA